MLSVLFFKWEYDVSNVWNLMIHSVHGLGRLATAASQSSNTSNDCITQSVFLIQFTFAYFRISDILPIEHLDSAFDHSHSNIPVPRHSYSINILPNTTAYTPQ